MEAFNNQQQILTKSVYFRINAFFVGKIGGEGDLAILIKSLKIHKLSAQKLTHFGYVI